MIPIIIIPILLTLSKNSNDLIDWTYCGAIQDHRNNVPNTRGKVRFANVMFS
jgi:hypothetical protein